jgi:PAS domain S-box-containing protein
MVQEFLKYIDPGIMINSINDPKKALKIDLKEYDCILTDLKMPDIDGLELAKIIRNNNSNIPIIIYTGQGTDEVAEKAYSIGINDYIRKEISPSHYQVLAKRIRDIVEKKRTEDLYLKIVQSTKEAIIIVRNETIIFANQAFANFLGYENSKLLIGFNVMKIILPKDQEMIKARLVKYANNEILNCPYEMEIIRKDGKIIKIESNSTIIDYEGKKAILSISKDITQRKEIEDKLKNSEETFRNLVELSPDGIVTLDLKGKLTYVNPAFIELTGFEYNDLVGKHFIKVGTLRAVDIPKYIKAFSKILMGKMEKMEMFYKKKDGSMGWGEILIKLIEINHEKKQIILIARDVSKRKELESELVSYSKNLERLVEERTETMRESERLVTTGKLASMIGHDLRGPLNVIRNAIYLMNIKPEKSEEMKKVINESVDRAINMLDELREKAKEVQLDLKETDITTLLKNVLSETPIPPGIEARIEANEKIIVRIDELKIRRVFENLLRNAIEAMPDGGKLLINVRTYDGKVDISFIDSGYGIPDHIMKNLYKPFTTSKKNGTGLGLSYCKSTMDAHNSKITVETKIGKGTVFHLLFDVINNTSQSSQNELPKIIVATNAPKNLN